MQLQNSEDGRIIVIVLITVFTLSAFWFIALSTTGSELQQVGGRKSAAQQFFDAEAGLNLAMENFSNFTATLAGDVTTAVVYNTIKDPSNRVVAQVTIRPIQNVNAGIAAANGQPAQSHTSTPPAGSNSGVNSTVTRRYSINSVSSNKELQIGVFRIVPK